MRVRWTPEAADDLEQIAVYLWMHRPEWARSTLQTIYGQLMELRHHPWLGQTSGEGTMNRRMYLAPLPYVCIYRVDHDAVHVLQVRHTSRGPEPADG